MDIMSNVTFGKGFLLWHLWFFLNYICNDVHNNHGL
jgi:hypothetical protein